MQNAAFAARGPRLGVRAAAASRPDELEDAHAGARGARVRRRERHDPAQGGGRRARRGRRRSVNTLVVARGADPRLFHRPEIAAGSGSSAVCRRRRRGGGGVRWRRSRTRQFSRGGRLAAGASRGGRGRQRHAERDEVLVELRAGQTLVDLPYPARTAAAPRRPRRGRGAATSRRARGPRPQGAASYERWTGMPAPVEVMRAAGAVRSVRR